MRAIDHHPVRLRRSVLSVPADNQRALAKACELAADAVIFDLEDSVLPDRKAAARDALVRHLAGNRPQGETVIRVNAAGSGLARRHSAAACRAADAIRPAQGRKPRRYSGRARLACGKGTRPEELRALGDGSRRRAGVNGPAIAEPAAPPAAGLDCFVVGLNDLRKETGRARLSGPDLSRSWLMADPSCARRQRARRHRPGLTTISAIRKASRRSAAGARHGL